jgi:lysylphosphatidylglycerol synthetase-like protein (DUF2156 family)
MTQLVSGTHFAQVEAIVPGFSNPAAVFTVTLIPRITVMTSHVTRLYHDTVRVSVKYQCALDLSHVPVAPRLVGVLAQIYDVAITADMISFTAKRSSGLDDTVVELYDAVIDSPTSLAMLDARVSFTRDSDHLTAWVIGLGLFAAAALIAVAAFAVKTGLVCKRAADEEEEDDEYEFEPNPDDVSGTSYHSLQ